VNQVTSFLVMNSISSVGFEVLTAEVMKKSVCWDITPCSLLKVNRSFGGTCHLILEAKCSSETSVDFQRTKRRHIPEDKLFINIFDLQGSCTFIFAPPAEYNLRSNPHPKSDSFLDFSKV
jgi:hypothetical protein